MRGLELKKIAWGGDNIHTDIATTRLKQPKGRFGEKKGGEGLTRNPTTWSYTNLRVCWHPGSEPGAYNQARENGTPPIQAGIGVR